MADNLRAPKGFETTCPLSDPLRYEAFCILDKCPHLQYIECNACPFFAKCEKDVVKEVRGNKLKPQQQQEIIARIMRRQLQSCLNIRGER